MNTEKKFNVDINLTLNSISGVMCFLYNLVHSNDIHTVVVNNSHYILAKTSTLQLNIGCIY